MGVKRGELIKPEQIEDCRSAQIPETQDVIRATTLFRDVSTSSHLDRDPTLKPSTSYKHLNLAIAPCRLLTEILAQTICICTKGLL